MSDANRLTFAQFQATGKDVEDLRKVHVDFGDERYYPDPIPARVYCDGQLYLEPKRGSEGEYVVEVGNSGVDGGLERCEAYLYGFYVCEMADDDVREELMAAAPDVTREHWQLG